MNNEKIKMHDSINTERTDRAERTEIKESENYNQYCYYFNLMRDFEALGIDTTELLNAEQYEKYEALVNDLYELNEVEIIGLPELIQSLHKAKINR